jgi:hypothetical protein
VSDLDRLFRLIVRNLAAGDPARLEQPIAVSELIGSVVPYRASRRALGVESSEDYELLLLRLCAAEDGYVRTAPEEVRRRFVREAGSPHPDLSVLSTYGTTTVTLAADRLARVLEAGPEAAFAPPVVPAPPAAAEPFAPVAVAADADPELEADLAFETEIGLPAPDARGAPADVDHGDRPARGAATAPAAAERCRYCRGRLPAGRSVNFCPHCGRGQSLSRCPECRAEVESGWRHCIACGIELTAP